jgi:hypothetical protein
LVWWPGVSIAASPPVKDSWGANPGLPGPFLFGASFRLEVITFVVTLSAW